MTDLETWKERVAEWRASGLTAEEFCAQREFGRSALFRWSSKLGMKRRRRVQGTMPVARLIPRPSEKPSTWIRDGGSVCIELGGVRVVVAGGVDKATLTSVLDVLESRTRQVSR